MSANDTTVGLTGSLVGQSGVGEGYGWMDREWMVSSGCMDGWMVSG